MCAHKFLLVLFSSPPAPVGGWKARRLSWRWLKKKFHSRPLNQRLPLEEGKRGEVSEFGLSASCLLHGRVTRPLTVFFPSRTWTGRIQGCHSPTHCTITLLMLMVPTVKAPRHKINKLLIHFWGIPAVEDCIVDMHKRSPCQVKHYKLSGKFTF